MTKAVKITASKLTSHIGYWMRLISNNVSHPFARKLESSGVTVAEWVVLREMYSHDETISPSTIADLTGLSRGAVSKLIDRLLSKKLVTRREASNDRRFQDIEMTQQAIKLIPKLVALADQNDEEFFSVLNKTERNQLTLLLKKLAANHKLVKHPIK